MPFLPTALDGRLERFEAAEKKAGKLREGSRRGWTVDPRLRQRAKGSDRRRGKDGRREREKRKERETEEENVERREKERVRGSRIRVGGRLRLLEKVKVSWTRCAGGRGELA
ncbi:hypothetical protein R1sor_017427 [Riccia sorocarpa]|uniref:Uncharacterized protein n=1 Tax=Riccia sorocarpa TaxID=122646 RepID=A0ABD3I6U2_9MARC